MACTARRSSSGSGEELAQHARHDFGTAVVARSHVAEAGQHDDLAVRDHGGEFAHRGAQVARAATAAQSAPCSPPGSRSRRRWRSSGLWLPRRSWISRTVSGRPGADERRLLHQYATWHVIRRLRGRLAGQHATYGQFVSTQRNVRAAITLLDWLAARGLDLESARQGDLDTWMNDAQAVSPAGRSAPPSSASACASSASGPASHGRPRCSSSPPTCQPLSWQHARHPHRRRRPVTAGIRRRLDSLHRRRQPPGPLITAPLMTPGTASTNLSS